MTEKLIKADSYDTALDTVMQAMMLAVFLVVMLPMIPVVQSAQKYFKSQYYEGQSDPRTLNVTHTLQHITISNPWIGAYFINDGPNAVEIKLNNTDDNPFIINPGETITVNRAGARDRIYAIYHKCHIGTIAIVRVIGEY